MTLTFKNIYLLAMRRILVLIGTAALAASLGAPSAAAPTQPPARNEAAARIPISDLGAGTYLGFQGGLYANGSNLMPVAHRQAGLTRALRVRPLDAAGNPNANGKHVLLSIGMSNTTMEWCSGSAGCAPWSFIGRAAADPQVNHTSLAIVDGAKGGETAEAWISPGEADYNRIRTPTRAARALREAGAGRLGEARQRGPHCLAAKRDR